MLMDLLTRIFSSVKREPPPLPTTPELIIEDLERQAALHRAWEDYLRDHPQVGVELETTGEGMTAVQHHRIRRALQDAVYALKHPLGLEARGYPHAPPKPPMIRTQCDCTYQRQNCLCKQR